MLIGAVQRAEAGVTDMLACANSGAAAAAELREALESTKAIRAKLDAFGAAAAVALAGAESHGDGGAGVLARAAGLTRRQAQDQVQTAGALQEMPALRDAVESGRVSMANAKCLTDASAKTDPQAVQSDADLLAQAESMAPEHFAKTARRWAAQHQHDGGEADFARRRARRRVSIWDGDDGMVYLRGEFDPVTGARIRNRLRAEARRAYDADKKHACGDERRSFPQCMADALDNLTAAAGPDSGAVARRPVADIAVVAHLDAENERIVAELAGGEPLPASVLEELMCNSAVVGVLYGTKGVPLWRGHAKRTATAAQTKALISRHGGCFACSAHPAMCQAHHIKPWSQGGPTNIDNMVLICWSCHQKVHHHNWRIARTGAHLTLEPPNPLNYGPAHAPDPPSARACEAWAVEALNFGPAHAPDPPSARACDAWAVEALNFSPAHAPDPPPHPAAVRRSRNRRAPPPPKPGRAAQRAPTSPTAAARRAERSARA